MARSMFTEKKKKKLDRLGKKAFKVKGADYDQEMFDGEDKMLEYLDAATSLGSKALGLLYPTEMGDSELKNYKKKKEKK